MSSNIPEAQQVSKLNPAAAAFVPKDVVETVQEMIDGGTETSMRLDRYPEISDDEILARFNKMCGESYWDVRSQEDWMDAIIDQDVQIAHDCIKKTSCALRLVESSHLPVEAFIVISGGEDIAAGSGCFDKLPTEVQQKIFKMALTADDGIISMQCLSNKSFRPNVATGLLRTCKKIYHQARDHLYEANTIIFDQFGSDLKALAKPLGLSSCHAAGCSMALERPKFADIIFDIGDHAVDWQGAFKTAMFTNAMKDMRCKIDTDHLTIALRSLCFAENIRPQDFAEGLDNINVIKSMTMCGSDHHWETGSGNLRAIPEALRLNKQPVNTAIYPRNPFLQPCLPDLFSSTYVPAKDDREITAVAGERFFDAGEQYQEWAR